MKNIRNITKYIVGAIALVVALLQSDAVSKVLGGLIAAHPKLAAIVAGLITVGTLLHDPRVRAILQLDASSDDPKASTAGQSGYVRGGALLLLLVVGLVALFGVACTDWERTTFQTLAVSKAAVEQAVADYNKAVIPQTAANRAIVDKTRNVHNTAVIAFRDYWCVAHPSKPVDPTLGAGPCVSFAPGEVPSQDAVAKARDKLTIALAAIPEAVAQIKQLLK